MIETMARALVVSVRLHDSRYHGLPEWPPAPARMFQALVAGSGTGGLSVEVRAALAWLETLKPPIIGSPIADVGQGFTAYVPNNDLDTVGHDPDRTSEIRVGKWIKPRLLNDPPVFLYIWDFSRSDDDEHHAQTICSMANHLYQFGRGVDMAWAWGEVIGGDQVDARLELFCGRVHRPSEVGGDELSCPRRGSLHSLEDRHRANRERFRVEGYGATSRSLFSQAPHPNFETIPYDSPPARRVFELRDSGREASFAPWLLARVSTFVQALRDRAAERLKRALPNRANEIERVFVGRKPDGADAGPLSSRVRIVPLPSIGHQHADRRIRRVLVEVSSECPLSAEDVFWAFSGVDLSSRETGEILAMVTPSADYGMLNRFAGKNRLWRTVTAAALPDVARRRRIDPTRMVAEAKGGAERAAEEMRAAAAVSQALRHAGVRTQPERIRVQREPFEAKSDRAEAFAPDTRFAKERLWHVEIAFGTPVAGPLVIGDGRFLGLGVMAPAAQAIGVFAFAIKDGLVGTPQAADLTRALRRAVMARVQHELGPRVVLPMFISGHEASGAPSSKGGAHLTFSFDPSARRLLVLAPHVLERRAPTGDEIDRLATLDSALADFRELRAGAAGLLKVRATLISEEDPLLAASRTWESVTPYQVTRHVKHIGAAEALSLDLRAECRRFALPEPSVTPLELNGVSNVGLVARARLEFAAAVPGPILLGRSRHLGGGLFRAIAAASGRRLTS